jgi:hypothetical protein
MPCSSDESEAEHTAVKLKMLVEKMLGIVSVKDEHRVGRLYQWDP